MPDSALLRQLDLLTHELSEAYGDYAVCWEVERRAKTATLEQALGTNMPMNKADAWALTSTTDAAVETVKCVQRIKSLELQISTLRLHLQYDNG